MANRNRSAEKEAFWRLVLEEHANSGLNAREFCRREALSEPSFYSWRRRIQNRDMEPRNRELLPVKVVPSEQPTGNRTRDFPVEIVTGGIVIGVNDTCSVDAIVRVLTAAQRLAKEDSSC